jgi:hypothetical protein
MGHRLAFNRAKGAAGVVCPRCAAWNITPLEERWEAAEWCERRYSELRVRQQPPIIGFAGAPKRINPVRIGVPLLPEWASWRCGDQFRVRFRRNTRWVVSTDGALAARAKTPQAVPLQPSGPSRTKCYSFVVGPLLGASTPTSLRSGGKGPYPYGGRPLSLLISRPLAGKRNLRVIGRVPAPASLHFTPWFRASYPPGLLGKLLGNSPVRQGRWVAPV